MLLIKEKANAKRREKWRKEDRRATRDLNPQLGSVNLVVRFKERVNLPLALGEPRATIAPIALETRTLTGLVDLTSEFSTFSGLYTQFWD